MATRPCGVRRRGFTDSQTDAPAWITSSEQRRRREGRHEPEIRVITHDKRREDGRRQERPWRFQVGRRGARRTLARGGGARQAALLAEVALELGLARVHGVLERAGQLRRESLLEQPRAPAAVGVGVGELELGGRRGLRGTMRAEAVEEGEAETLGRGVLWGGRRALGLRRRGGPPAPPPGRPGTRGAACQRARGGARKWGTACGQAGLRAGPGRGGARGVTPPPPQRPPRA